MRSVSRSGRGENRRSALPAGVATRRRLGKAPGRVSHPSETERAKSTESARSSPQARFGPFWPTQYGHFELSVPELAASPMYEPTRAASRALMPQGSRDPAGRERRVCVKMSTVLSILDDCESKGTVFVQGASSETFPIGTGRHHRYDPWLPGGKVALGIADSSALGLRR